MDTTEKLQLAEKLLDRWTATFSHPAPERLDVVLGSQDVVEAARLVREGHWGYLAAITGMDCPAPQPTEAQPEPAEGLFEVLYQIVNGAAIVTLRVSLPYSQAVVPSVCSVYPYATLYERELIELLGVQVEGTPSTEHLILPDDWPDGVYPLRKSFTGFNKDTQAKES